MINKITSFIKELRKSRIEKIYDNLDKFYYTNNKDIEFPKPTTNKYSLFLKEKLEKVEKENLDTKERNDVLEYLKITEDEKYERMKQGIVKNNDSNLFKIHKLK